MSRATGPETGERYPEAGPQLDFQGGPRARARLPARYDGLADDPAREGLPAHAAARAGSARRRAARSCHPGRSAERRARGVRGSEHLNRLPHAGAARRARPGPPRAHHGPRADVPLDRRTRPRTPGVSALRRYHRGGAGGRRTAHVRPAGPLRLPHRRGAPDGLREVHFVRIRLINALLDKRVARWLLLLYAVAVAAVVLEPFPGAANGSVDVGYRAVQALHLSSVVTPEIVEFVWNILLFVPLTFLGAVLLPRLRWEQWVGLALIASSTIEFIQLLMLPDRTASVRDIVSNTLGGLIGALAARSLARRREHHRQSIG